MNIPCAKCGEEWDHSHIESEFVFKDRLKIYEGDGCPACDVDSKYEHDRIVYAAKRIARYRAECAECKIDDFLERLL